MDLLTQVVIDTLNENVPRDCFGVSIVNPLYSNYCEFLRRIATPKNHELYFPVSISALRKRVCCVPGIFRVQDFMQENIPLRKNLEILEIRSEPTNEIIEKCLRLNVILKSYGINAELVDDRLVQSSARFLCFKLILKPGESINNLKKKREDIARELEAVGAVSIDNIKGTRFVGLDVPFFNMGEPLSLLDNLHRLSEGDATLSVLAGQQPDGKFRYIDLAKAPHMLVAGTTGSGKTIFLYSIIVSLVSQLSDDELELLIIDPKQTDFHFFESLPCLRGNKVIVDAAEAIKALGQVNTKDKALRTREIRSANCRDIDSYNAKNPEKKMKRLVIIIDEYADLVQAAELQGKDVRKEFETNLCMLAQRVRNLGIHLVIATQQPRAAVVTSSLKAALPFRVSFRLPSHVDSQTILDRAGAEDLLGKGDMLMKTDDDLLRLQGFFISEDELNEFVQLKTNR